MKNYRTVKKWIVEWVKIIFELKFNNSKTEIETMKRTIILFNMWRKYRTYSSPAKGFWITYEIQTLHYPFQLYLMILDNEFWNCIIFLLIALLNWFIDLLYWLIFQTYMIDVIEYNASIDWIMVMGLIILMEGLEFIE